MEGKASDGAVHVVSILMDTNCLLPKHWQQLPFRQ